MERRSCQHLHFIQAIRSGVVEKIRNIDSRGRPPLVLKSLKDIYESEDAKRFSSLSTIQSEDRYENMVFHGVKVEFGSPYPPIVKRETKKRDRDANELDLKHSTDEEGSDLDDLNFGKITLKQLKERCKTKKRKVLHSDCLTVKQENGDWLPEEDETDLKETISSWKSKLSKKLLGKKRHSKKSAPSSTSILSLAKSEQILSNGDCSQTGGSSPSSIDFKVEDSEIEHSETSDMIFEAGDTILGCSGQTGLCREVYTEAIETSQTCTVNEVCYDHLEDTQGAYIIPSIGRDDEVKVEDTETEHSETLDIIFEAGDTLLGCSEQTGLCGEVYTEAVETSQTCTVNEVCYDHLEDTQGAYIIPSIGRDNEILEYPEMTFQQLANSLDSEGNEEDGIEKSIPEDIPLETTLPFMDQGSDLCSSSLTNSSVLEISRQTSGISGVQGPVVTIESTASDLCKDGIYENFPLDIGVKCSSHEIDLLSGEDDPLSSQKPPVMPDYLGLDKSTVVLVGDPTVAVEKQPLRSPHDDVESNSPNKNPQYDTVYDISRPETENHRHVEHCRPPERLLSTRKVISPNSQERLCQAMKGVELGEDIDHYKCKEKLQFRRVTGKPSTARQETEDTEVGTDLEELGAVNRTKPTIIPKQMTKKRFYPPKGNQRSPDLARSFPNISTGTTSTQRCSESAIAFSLRQMHDIEGLAMKLMQELKSMKDVVEGKLQCETSSIEILKYDGEVKKAIKSATKVEETTKKWLSIMTRDCNRFCTIMKLSEKGEMASENTINRERRKITFADEAGGVLCHVKVFEDGMACANSES